MNTKFFKVSWADVWSALVSGLIMALIVIITNILAIGDIFKLDWAVLINAGVIAFLTSIVSFLKSLLTTDSGKFIGLVKVK